MHDQTAATLSNWKGSMVSFTLTHTFIFVHHSMNLLFLWSSGWDPQVSQLFVKYLQRVAATVLVGPVRPRSVRSQPRSGHFAG